MRPTNNFRWFRVNDNYVCGDKPLAQIAGYPECGPTWYCLKQLWISEYVGERDEWRDIEVSP